jgi:hypothetical protein
MLAIHKKSTKSEYRHNIMAVEEHSATFLIMEAAKYIGKFFHKEEKGDFRAAVNYFHADPYTSK